MIDHVAIEVGDYWEAMNFYTAVLGTLGCEVVSEYEGSAGFGQGGKPDSWIRQGKPTSGLHLAFPAHNRREVERFHRIALQGGARDNGPPGLRPRYHVHYYGAFVLDADGRNIEAVCHERE
jgi:catechol 2,3-dioxygenase-like lactoylglutathione lyase family enzyme